MLGITDRSRGCLFDLDGVLTQAATVHAAAWQQMFEAGLRRAVVTSSANAAGALKAAGLSGRDGTVVDGTVVDGTVARREGLAGKPAPDSYRYAATALGPEPSEAVVYEDALAGVAAGRAGHAGFVVGVDRAGQAGALREAGADVVVGDLAELLDER